MPPERDQVMDARLMRPAMSLRSAGLAGMAAILLSWPMLLMSGPLLFPDVIYYVSDGAVAVRRALDLLLPFPLSADAVPWWWLEGQNSIANRSVLYAAFVYVTSLSPLGLLGSTLVQSWIVLFLLGALVRLEWRAPVRDIALAILLCGALSSLPWFVAFAMPDLLAAAVILHAAILVRSFDDLGTPQRILLCAIAAFAVATHYGNLPLTLACCGAALALRAWQGRLGRAVLVAAVAPFLLASLVNFGGGMLETGRAEASIAPKRFPILLARSITDGPAHWYLERSCATERYTICEMFDRIPRDVGLLLWDKGSIVDTGTPEQLARIRAEEPLILWRTLQAYPVAQLWSTTRNALQQLTLVGTGDFIYPRQPAPFGPLSPNGIVVERGVRPPWLVAVGAVHGVSVLAALLAILAMFRRDGLTSGLREREVLAVVMLGLLANAAIFGGLSAPVDRYQGRVAWLLPVLAALFWLQRRQAAMSLAVKPAPRVGLLASATEASAIGRDHG